MAGVIGRSGGQRPGAGRKPGRGVTRTQVKIAVEIAERLGVQPIQIMLEQMTYAQRKWQEAKTDIEAGRGSAEFLEMRREQMNYFFTAAHDRAIAAAPYLHPRIASITLEGNPENPVQVQHAINELAEMLDEIARAKSAKVINAEPTKLVPAVSKKAIN